MTTYEIWTNRGLIKECYSYPEFKKEFLSLKHEDDLRAYSIADNPKNNKYYRLSGNKIISETNYFNN